MQETVNIPRDHLKELVECLEAATSDLEADLPLVRDSELAIQDAKNALGPA